MLTVVAAFSVLRRARNRAFNALREHSQAHDGSIDDARATLARLIAEMGEVQLDLSFGVEAYLDSVLIPDSLMQRNRNSVLGVFRVEVDFANTSRMVERLEL